MYCGWLTLGASRTRTVFPVRRSAEDDRQRALVPDDHLLLRRRWINTVILDLAFVKKSANHIAVDRLTENNQMSRKTKVAVVMIGTNNTGHFDQDPEEVADGVESILDIIKTQRTETKILLLGIFPRGQSPHDLKRLNNIAINQRIRRFADNDRVHYMDIGNEFLEADGTISKDIMPDYLHINAERYERWAKAIQPTLEELGL